MSSMMVEALGTGITTRSAHRPIASRRFAGAPSAASTSLNVHVHSVFRRASRSRRLPCKPVCVAAPVAQAEAVGEQKTSNKRVAVVVGGSVAGSITAQAISCYFDKVIVLERDAALDKDARKGVPQYTQPHIMLLKGLVVLESLWPGFKQQLYDAGANPIDYGLDIRTMYNGQWVKNYEFGKEDLGISASRALVEDNIRQRLRTNAKVEIVPGAPVTGLQYDSVAKQVTGVQLKSGELVSADLVIDATGRGSKAPQWLQDLGYTAPPEISINARIVYATANVKPRTPAPPKILNCFTPPFNHCVVMPVEGGTCQVILAGINPPPTAREEFLNWALTELPDPYVHDFLQDCDFVTDPRHYTSTDNVLRQYDQCPELPDGLVMVGDAVAAFNPVYGQGMSCGAIAAETLAQVLQPRLGDGASPANAATALKGMPMEFQAKLAAALAFPWTVATAQDSKLVGDAAMSKPPSPAAKLVTAYLEELMVAARSDPSVHRPLSSMMHMVAPPSAVFAPPIAAKVLWSSLKRRLGLASPTTPASA